MCVYEMGNLRVIDLSKILDPATETRRCHLFRFNTGGPIPDFHTHMDLMSHLGTHCECPYHHDDNWPSAADLPLTTFLGFRRQRRWKVPRRRFCGSRTSMRDVTPIIC